MLFTNIEDIPKEITKLYKSWKELYLKLHNYVNYSSLLKLDFYKKNRICISMCGPDHDKSNNLLVRMMQCDSSIHSSRTISIAWQRASFELGIEEKKYVKQLKMV